MGCEPNSSHLDSQCPTESRCSILDLSSELIFMIMNHLPFLTQFDLARTCKRLAIIPRDILQRHQDSHKKYRVASDLEPSTVPLLLRSAFGQADPIPAWHVRSFEVWRDRTAWSQWQTFDLHSWLENGADDRPSQVRVSREDARRYLYWFEEQLGEDLNSELVEQLLEQIESGMDGILKVLLFAKLERLKDLKFVTRSQAAGSCLDSMRVLTAECIKNGEDDWDGARSSVSESCSDGDEHDIEKEVGHSGDDTNGGRTPNVKAPWPIGLHNIQNVAVGVASGTWMDDTRPDESCLFLFSHLLRLPSLNSIYFNRLCAETEDDSEEEEVDYELLPKGSSSVRHIFLHGCSGNLGEDESDLWAAPRELLTMSLRFDGPEEYDGATGTASSVAIAQKHSLQSLMWYGYTGGISGSPRNILGDHCTILDNEEFDSVRSLPAMKHMSVCMADIELCMEHSDTYHCLRSEPEEGWLDEDDEGNIYDDEVDHDEFVVRRVATMFPRSMETLTLWDCADETMTGLIERGLVKMIQGGQYKNLKAIFSENTETATEMSKGQESWFKDVVAAGKEAGVEVFTLSSDRNGKHHSIPFAEAPDEYDLHTGLHGGVRPSDWVFDPYLGRRIPPGSKAEKYTALSAHLKAEREAYWRLNEMMSGAD